MNRDLLRFAALTIALMLTGVGATFAQLSGTKTIGSGGDYATFTLAINDLNSQGVTSPGVTFNVTAGATFNENPPAITATGTSAAPIVFQRNGAGANPLVVPSTVGTLAPTAFGNNGDAIFRIVGGDYITFNGINVSDNGAFADATERFEYGYLLSKVDGTNGPKNITIRNSTITLDKTTPHGSGIYLSNLDGSGTAVTVTDIGGRSESIKIFNNSISNSYHGVQLRGFLAASPYDFYDHFVEVGVDGANSVTSYGGGSATAYGIYAIYQDSLKLSGNTINGGSGTTTTLYGIFTTTGTNSSVDINGNTVTIEGGGTTSTIYAINNSMGSTGTNNTVNMYNNIVENCTYPTATSGALYLLYQNASPMTANIYGNIVRNNTRPGTTGATYCLYSSNTATNGTANVYSNTVHGNSSSTTGVLYGIWSNEATSTIKKVYGNTVYNISGGGAVHALNTSTGSSAEVYKNNVYDITGTGTASIVYGIHVVSGTTVHVYNNFVSDLKAPSGNTTDAVRGLYVAGGTTINAFYNTIYLNASSSSSTFGTSAISTSSTPTLDLRNNIAVNVSTPGSTSGNTVAYRRSTTTLTSYSSNSNNNCFFAGSPASNRLIFFDGTNSDQVIGDFKARVSPRDVSSFTENPPFQNVSSTPYDLHMNTGIATQTESGGIPVSTPIAITDDFDGNVRNVTTPDVGADEFAGTGADLTPPAITYTPLNDGTIANRTLVATITDPGGVASGGNNPRLYYKKLADVSYAIDSSPSLLGNDYTFTFNYALVGGGAVAIGDTIEYYVAAQDGLGNSGTNPPGGSGASPPGTTPPSTRFKYGIKASISGTMTVGTAGTFATITAAVDSLNKSVITGPVTFSLTDASYAGETLPISINHNVGSSATNTVTIKPSSGVTPTISGSSANAVFKLNGADYVIIDGSNTVFAPEGIELARDLTIENTNSATNTAVIWLSSLGAGQGAMNNIVKNCNLRAGVDQSTGTLTTFGIISSGTTISTSSAGADNDNNSFLNNFITRARYGIQLYGVSGNNNTGNTISGNTIGPSNFGSEQIGKAGVTVHYQTGVTITQNTIRHVGGTFATTSAGTDRIGIGLSTDAWTVSTTTNTVDAIVTRNLIHNISEERTFAAVGIALGGSSSSSNNTVANNVIHSVLANGTSTDQALGIGIGAGSGHTVVFNSISMTGLLDPVGTTTATQSAAGIRISSTGVTNLSLRNNAISVDITSSTGTLKHYAIVAPSAAYAWGTGGSNNNDYFVNTGNSQMVLGGIGTTVPYTEVATLGAWQGTFTPNQDANSLNVDPLYNSPTDPQPQSGSPLLAAGVTVPGITTDFLGITRGSPPSIGAYESTGDFSPPSISYTPLVNTSSTANRSFTAVTITDPSGVNTTPGTRPRVYYKKTTNANTYNSNTSGTDGWKYAEATGASSPFDFVIDYSRLFPSGTVSPGEQIQYFVVAQDLATPNVGIQSGTFASQPASVNLSAAAFPISGSINSYFVSIVLSGALNVGSGQTYTSLTNAGGFFEAVNNGVLSGNVTANITSHLTSETGAIALSDWTESGGGGYTLTIKSSDGTARTISGAATGALIKLSNADRVTIDGSNAGDTTRNITIMNTTSASASAAIWLSSQGVGNGATNNTIKNCIISAGADQSTGSLTTFGIISSGLTISITSDGTDNDNNRFENNYITKSRYAIYIRGAAADANTGTVITRNLIGPALFGSDEIGKGGIIVEHQDGVEISRNTVRYVGGVFALTSGGSDRVGIGLGDDSWTATSSVITNATVTRNLIHNIVDERTFAAVGIVIAASGAATNNLIANNVIHNVRANGTSTDQALGIGIADGDGDRVVFNSISMTGDLDPTSATTATQSAAGIRVSSATAVENLTLKNNAILVDVNSNTGTLLHYAIVAPATTFAWGTGGADNNDYFVNTSNPQMALGGIGTTVPYTAVTTLGAWQGTFTPAQDAASIAADPLYNGPDNLRPQLGSPLLAAGAPISGVTVDFTGATRGAPPTIGAYEAAGDAAGPAIIYTLLANTTSTSNRQLTATITDPSVVQTGVNGPRLYYKKKTDVSYVVDASPSVSSNDFTFTINYALVGGGSVTANDTIQYYVAAQDVPGNSSTNPSGGSGSTPPGTTPPPAPNIYKIIGAPLSGDITVGLTAFNEALGKNLTVGLETRTVFREVPINVSKEQPPGSQRDAAKTIGRTGGSLIAPVNVDVQELSDSPGEEERDAIQTHLVEVEVQVPVLLEDGKPYSGPMSIPVEGTDDLPGIFPTITAAVTNLNERGVSGPVRFLLVDATYPSETFPITITSFTGSSAGNTVTIKPASGVSPLIGGNGASLFLLNGADNIIFDGSNIESGSSRDMTLRDSSTTSPVIDFVNDATDNTIMNCVIEGSVTSTTNGVIRLSTAVSSGNSNIIITNNQIRDRSDDASVTAPANAIYSSGTAAAPNSNVSVTFNEIFNFSGSGIRGTTASGSGWVMKNNSFFNNRATPPTTTQTSINFTPGSGSGGHDISSNFIGGTAVNAGGSPWTNSGSVTFGGITVSVDTVSASVIAGNTIQNINTTATGSAPFTGISLTGGRVNIVGNTIGHNTTANSITVAGTSTSHGISVTGTYLSDTTRVTDNVVANISATGTGTAVRVRGINATGPRGYRISGNTFHSLSTNSGGTGIGATNPVAMGIYFFPGSTFYPADIVDNTIHGIAANNNGALATVSTGMLLTNFLGRASRNMIYDVRNLSTGTTATTPPIASGIYLRFSDSNAEISNNMISVGTDQSTNTQFNGIWNAASNSSNTVRVIHNSINVGGTATTGTLNSHAFMRGDNTGAAVTTTSTLRNNILNNTRSGGTGKNYAIANASTVANDTGWSASTSDYNVLNADPSTIGLWGPADQTLAGWQSASGGDGNSVTGDPLYLSATDLHITSLTSPAGNAGTGGTGVGIDIDGNTRDAFTPDIGADEFGPLSTVSVDVPISTGWNMISNPVVRSAGTDSVKLLYPTSLFSYAFAFAAGAGYQQSFTMANGPGYWGKFPGAGSNTIVGGPNELDTIPVLSGWNLIGSVSLPVDTSTITSIPGGIKISHWFGFSAGYQAVTSIVPGKAYWVKASQAGSFIFAGSSDAPARAVADVQSALSSLNSITVADAAGNSQTLYFGADHTGVNADQFEMPPAPPVGILDARFVAGNAGFMVRSHPSMINSSLDIPFVINAVAYPLTVSWNILSQPVDAEHTPLAYSLHMDGGTDVVMSGAGSISLERGGSLAIRVAGSDGLPETFGISQNYPNPFNPSTTISYALPVESRVTLEVYNMLGQRVAVLMNDIQKAGYHATEWDGRGVDRQALASGVYFYRIDARPADGSGQPFQNIMKMLLLK